MNRPRDLQNPPAREEICPAAGGGSTLTGGGGGGVCLSPRNVFCSSPTGSSTPRIARRRTKARAPKHSPAAMMCRSASRLSQSVALSSLRTCRRIHLIPVAIWNDEETRQMAFSSWLRARPRSHASTSLKLSPSEQTSEPQQVRERTARRKPRRAARHSFMWMASGSLQAPASTLAHRPIGRSSRGTASNCAKSST